MDKARDCMLERKAFGRPIVDFQALQFKLADMAVDARYQTWFIREGRR